MEDALKSIIIDAVDKVYIGNSEINTLVIWASQPVIYSIIFSIGMGRLHQRMSKNAKNR